ncbi:hypothetical protein [Natrinema sp. 1APR25-10V2]|uniref:hypothetical protein n=1 Tax=Natrinema sp. 1APR25-10V2 TaxID=2951081 RepID=UPI00287602E3|nr:hypothetical protein [Natrinema sp. 1APR25-10V2]MDS0477045.1 hypothetical protein [Natrinema sp. 1APR25-10V2]
MTPSSRDQRAAGGRDRREFLRTVGTAGYALGIAQVLGVEDVLDAAGEVEITTALVRPEPAEPWTLEERTKTVPADWHAAVTTACDLNRRLARTRLPGYLGSMVVPGDYRDPGATISVGVSAAAFDRTRPILEELLEGIAYDVETIEQDAAQAADRSKRPLRFAEHIDNGPVPGGITCRAKSGLTASLATLTPALYDPRAERTLFATASHAVPGATPTDGELWLPLASGQTVPLGRVTAAHPTADVLTVASDGPCRPASVIAGPTRQRVRGQFTRLGLADLAARGKSLEKVGARTGHTTGRIEGIDAVTCLTGETCRHGQLRWGDERDMADGDSGSVSYRSDPAAPGRGVLVAGFNTARTWWPGQNYIWGTAAYQLTAQYGYHF